MSYLSIDFETGSEADLKKVGAAKYAEDPTTRIICVAYTTPWNLSDPKAIKRDYIAPGFKWVPPIGLIDWVRTGEPVRAWNAMFEYWIWQYHVTDIARDVPRLKLEQLHDTMTQAAYWGLPLSLDMAGQALPGLGIVKDKAGQALMKRMSRPRGTDQAGNLIWWDADPGRRMDLMNYCEQDVRTEMAIADYLPPLPPREREIRLMDARANARGMALDVTLAGRMKKIAMFEQTRLDKDLSDETGGLVTGTNKAKALADWCVAQGLPEAADGLAKDRLPMLISKADEAGLFAVANALSIRQEAAKSSVAKLDAMMNYAGGRDYRMRGLTQYYGAFRTGRWAGRGPQVQNFPRSEVKDQEGLVNVFRSQRKDWTIWDSRAFEAIFGVSPLTGVSSALRGCIWVPDGEGQFASLDFSQIEARVLAWLAGSDKILDAYRSGKDLYVLAASGIYKVPEAQVDPDQRQVGKVSVLALGYQGGVGAFQTMAKVYGLTIPDELAEDIKTKWREANPEIVSYWWDVQKAAIEAVKARGWMVEVRRGNVRIMFSSWRGHLVCRLPSGRDLIYREAEVGQGTYGDELTYMGIDQYTRQWKRISTYGGKLVENITQAVARDCMADALLALDKLPRVRVLGSVHDEALLWLKPNAPPLDELGTMMSEAPGSWAKGLPLEADGYVGRRFKK